MERFVVVHGQIMLNQFRHYHIKAVANSAFVSSLKAKMEQRRHCKLYFAPKVGPIAGSISPAGLSSTSAHPVRGSCQTPVLRVQGCMT